MVAYLIRRLIWAVLLMLTVTAIGFALFYLVPSDPARQACGKVCTPAQLKIVAHQLGTDRPLYEQYFLFLGRLLPFSFSGGPHFKSPYMGESYFSQQTVAHIINMPLIPSESRMMLLCRR